MNRRRRGQARTASPMQKQGIEVEGESADARNQVLNHRPGSIPAE